MSIQALREQRGAKVREMHAFHEAHKSKDWSKDATLGEKWETMDREVADLDNQIAREQKLMDLNAGKAFDDVIRNPGKKLDPESPNARALFAKFLRQGGSALNVDEWTVVRNTMSTTTNSEGGFTVQTEIGKTVVDALRSFGNMRQVATVIQTAQGNPMTYPNSDGTTEVGELIAENGSANSADIVFGTTALNTYKYSSRIVAVPIELLQDSSVDVEALVVKRLAQRLARITQQQFTTGTGTNQPRGIVTAATSGVVGTTGQTATVTYDNLIDLQHSVDVGYRELGNCRYMFHDATLAVIRKLKDSQNRPLYIAGYETQGIAGGVPDMLLGQPVSINNSMATMAANARSILFGDPSFYVIRDAMDVTLYRFTDSVYTSKGQVGFLAWMRSGGNYTDVGGGVKYYQNSAT